MIGYSFSLQSTQIQNADFYGTYQFNIHDMDNIGYLAVMPSSSTTADNSEGEFQWYNVEKEMLLQGICKIDNSLEPQEITKISEESMVSDGL